MSSSKFANSFFILSFIVLLLTVLGADPAGQHCSFKKFDSNGAFQSNLDILVNSLYQSAPSTGFAESSVGENKDKVNGLALCRGDVNEQDCQSCLADARTKIREVCSDRKVGVVWYDYCMLKYSGGEFFGRVDVRNHHRRCNWSWEWVRHNTARRKLFRRLAQEAILSPILFATGNRKQGLAKRVGRIYGMVQCTRDLSGNDCKKCLSKLMHRYQFICSYRDGGKIFAGSCTLRFETHPF